MRLLLLAAAVAAVVGCNRGQTASAQVLQRDAGNFLTPAIKYDAGTLRLAPPIADAGTMQLVPPTGRPPGTVPPPFPTGGTSGGVFPR